LQPEDSSASSALFSVPFDTLVSVWFAYFSGNPPPPRFFLFFGEGVSLGVKMHYRVHILEL